ncbi:uncharacterized protein LOC136062006 [Quercus suber]|uniref:uncharacterized protein LOC136062006 n=1 Tax=Quercus suber TaxID=58331 RepID=UPI0032DE7248
MEIIVRSMRITRQNELTHLDYQDAMFAELDEIDDAHMAALDSIVVQKQKVSEMNNKRIKAKSFATGDLVWKVILPIGVKDPYLGKWSPNWDGPFLISKVFDGNAYKLMDISSNEHSIDPLRINDELEDVFILYTPAPGIMRNYSQTLFKLD